MGQAREIMDRENHGATTLNVQDYGHEVKYLIYVYNTLDHEWVIEQPPSFPHFFIPACKRGQLFSYTLLPDFVNERYEKAGTTEISYKRVDGRKCAMSLMNPGAFPGTQWEAQLHDWNTDDQQGNNLNNFGCFWSLTAPHETEKLKVEIALFKERTQRTMNQLIRQAEQFHAAGELRMISPWMHFAMDYLGKQAVWHMSMDHMVMCPNCGASVKDGIAYHKNDFGEKCIIDMERYMKSVVVERPALQVAEEGDEDVPVAPKPRKTRTARG